MRRWTQGALGLLLAGYGVLRLTLSFAIPSVALFPPFRQSADLDGFTVNAELISVDAEGATLLALENRAISVISPPIPGAGQHAVQAEFVVSTPLAPPGGLETPVVFFWESEPNNFKSEDRVFRIGSDPTTVTFDIPAEARGSNRIGVQFPAMKGPIRLAAMRLVDISGVRDDVFSLVRTQLAAKEPVQGTSLNYVRGPSILAKGINHYLVSMLALTIGALIAVGAFRRRGTPRVAVPGALLSAVLIADAWATQNVCLNLVEESRQFVGQSDRDQIRLAYGDSVAWAMETLSRATPPDSTFAVLSDTGTTPGHRLGYLLAPGRTRIDRYERADYVVVLNSTSSRFDEQRQRFRVGDDPELGASEIARLAPTIYLLAIHREAPSGKAP